MDKITIVPIGGLANRMLAISSFISYCELTHKKLEVLWVRDKGLNCSFDRLFMSPQNQHVKIKDADIADLIIHDRPRRRNFRLTPFFHQFLYDKRVYETEYFDLRDHPEQWDLFLKDLENYKRSYIVACRQVYDSPGMLNHLKPNAEIETRIKKITDTFPPSVIGIHIRRTDNLLSIENSPLELYVEKMEEEIKQDPDVAFYVASDSLEEKHHLSDRFGTRIITSFNHVNRHTEEGIIDALTELYALSRTCKIIGSSESSFAIVAAEINGITAEYFF